MLLVLLLVLLASLVKADYGKFLFHVLYCLVEKIYTLNRCSPPVCSQFCYSRNEDFIACRGRKFCVGSRLIMSSCWISEMFNPGRFCATIQWPTMGLNLDLTTMSTRIPQLFVLF